MENDQETTGQGSSDAFSPSPPAGKAKGYKELEQRAFLLMLAGVSLLFLYLLKPFFSAVFWACVIGILFYPMQIRLQRQWGRPSLAALATLLVCMMVGIIPTLFIVFSFFQEGSELYQRVESGEINPSEYIDRIKQGFPAVQGFLDRFNIDLAALKEQLSGIAVTASRYVAQNAITIGQGTVQFFFGLGLMLYVAFFLLRDGPQLVALLIRALPLGDARERLLFKKFAEVTRATVKGNLVVAIVQGTLGGLIFWILGVGGAILWGVVMTVLSLIPLVGAALVWVPFAIYLFAVGEWVDGLVLVGFGAFVIGLADNVLRPILVGRDTKLPDYMVLLSTLGGFVLFGMNGFVIGPLIAVLFVAFWQIFMIEFNTRDNQQPPPEPAEQTPTCEND